jgi:hypothetical protein
VASTTLGSFVGTAHNIPLNAQISEILVKLALCSTPVKTRNKLAKIAVNGLVTLLFYKLLLAINKLQRFCE